MRETVVVSEESFSPLLCAIVYSRVFAKKDAVSRKTGG